MSSRAVSTMDADAITRSLQEDLSITPRGARVLLLGPVERGGRRH